MSYTIRKFQPETDVIKPFDCGVADLNGFLLETDGDTPNATLYDKELLAVTYVATDDATHDILAYFSILNDKIDREFIESKVWNRLSRKIPNAKRGRPIQHLRSAVLLLMARNNAPESERIYSSSSRLGTTKRGNLVAVISRLMLSVRRNRFTPSVDSLVFLIQKKMTKPC